MDNSKNTSACTIRYVLQRLPPLDEVDHVQEARINLTGGPTYFLAFIFNKNDCDLKDFLQEESETILDFDNQRCIAILISEKFPEKEKNVVKEDLFRKVNEVIDGIEKKLKCTCTHNVLESEKDMNKAREIFDRICEQLEA